MRNRAVLELEIEGEKYFRNFSPKERLILLGGGNIGQEVSRYASTLGFYVIVVDDRPAFANGSKFPGADEIRCDGFSKALEEINICETDYVVIVTRGHRYDLECLRFVLNGTMPRYIGMMASKRRSLGVRELLMEEGITQDTLDQIHTPIGLSIGAATPPEIGISIVAELISCRRKDALKQSKSHTLLGEDVDFELIHFLERDDAPKALLMVYETSGSTPVKSGAVMAVNQNLQIAGTIGGGCTEGIALQEARKLIGTGSHKSICLDMSNEIAAQSGMACGGQMKVWIEDIGQNE
jgi:xanthine dehydrogenase accessory factor